MFHRGSFERGLLLASLISAVGCVESAPPVLVVDAATGASNSGVASLALGLTDDDFDPDVADTTTYRIRANGAYLVREEIAAGDSRARYEYVEAGAYGTTFAEIPAGTYTFEVVTHGGDVVLTTDPIMADAGKELRIIGFGDRRDRDYRAFVDGGESFPADHLRARVVNVSAGHESMDVVACTSDSAADCTIVHPDLAYGEAFEEIIQVDGPGADYSYTLEPHLPAGCSYARGVSVLPNWNRQTVYYDVPIGVSTVGGCPRVSAGLMLGTLEL